MQIGLSVPDGIINEDVINAALEATTRGNEALAAHGMLPDLGEALARGLKWKPEPWVGERFELASKVANRGWGDCDDLGPWLAAQMRTGGEDARAFVRRSGKNKWHVLVEGGDGKIYDPSQWAGMKSSTHGRDLYRRVNRSIAGPGESAICAMPNNRERRWYARADLPLTDGIHVVGFARNQHVGRALDRAIAEYAMLCEGCHGIGAGVDGDTVGFSLGDIVSAAAPLAGAAFGGPAGAALGGALGPMAGGLVDSFMGGGGGGGSAPAPPAPAPAPAPAPSSGGGWGGGGSQGSSSAAKAMSDVAQLNHPPPPGWPPNAQTYSVPGPGGQGKGQVTFSPHGGPIIVRF